jgi:polygalacturonase
MNPKIEITEKVLEILTPGYTNADYKQAFRTWWQNPRTKDAGGMRLTDLGYNSLNRAGIKDHFVKFDEPIEWTNQLVIWVDNFVDCPFYLSKKGIHVFNEKMAVQLVLFSGNIAKFSSAKAKSLKST